MITSWLLDLTSTALASDPKLDSYSGFVEDSGEGRWTVQAAIEQAVPAEVLTSALFARFRSRHGPHLWGEDAVGHAQGVRRPCRARQGGRALMAGSRHQKGAPADPCCLVIFGATGDLTKRLLVPALYNLAASNLLPEALAIIGAVRTPMADDAFRKTLRDALDEFATRPVDETVAARLFACVTAVDAKTDDPDSFRRLGLHIRRVEAASQTKGNRLFYLATPPDAFSPIVRQLAQTGLTQEDERQPGWRRVIVEKPFGTDLALGQGAQPRAARRAARGPDLPDRPLSRQGDGPEHHDHAVRQRPVRADLEPQPYRPCPDHRGRDGRRRAARQVLRRHRRAARHGAQPRLPADLADRHGAARPLRRQRGALGEGRGAAGDPELRGGAKRCATASAPSTAEGRVKDADVPGYRSAPDVDPKSTTETFVALRLEIDNWRWAGVPFYLRTGKALARRRTEIAIKFKEPPFAMFRETTIGAMAENYLVLGIQPDEGITLQFNAKTPGPAIDLASVGMTFRYKDYFSTAPSTGYETLIYDCMIGDALLFQRADGVEAGWRAVQPFLDAWKAAGGNGLSSYAAGSEGPSEADELLTREGRRWRPLNGETR